MTALARVLAELDHLADDELERAIGHAWTERQRRLVAELVVTTAPPSPSGLLDTTAAGVYLGGRSADFIRRQVRDGHLTCVRNVPGGRMGFALAELDRWKAAHASVAGGIGQGYSPPHDTPRRARAPKGARHDATRARGGPRAHGNDGRPVGARRATSDARRGAEPFTPSASAWRLPLTRPPDPEG